MRKLTAVGAAALLAACASHPGKLEVTRSATLPSTAPAAVWAAVGDFCGIGTWHPAVANCTLSEADGVPMRTLALKGGGEIVEKQVSWDDAAMSYTYAILTSPLPVADYVSTLSVSPDGAGSKIVWTGSFNASGASDADAENVIAGIYTAGIEGIAARAK